MRHKNVKKKNQSKKIISKKDRSHKSKKTEKNKKRKKSLTSYLYQDFLEISGLKPKPRKITTHRYSTIDVIRKQDDKELTIHRYTKKYKKSVLLNNWSLIKPDIIKSYKKLKQKNSRPFDKLLYLRVQYRYKILDYEQQSSFSIPMSDINSLNELNQHIDELFERFLSKENEYNLKGMLKIKIDGYQIQNYK